MDVVQSNIERMCGLISLDNRLGRGLSIILRVPLTLTIIPGLIIRAGGQHLAILRAAVVEILHDNYQTPRIPGVGGARISPIRNLRHSIIDREDVLGLEPLQEGGQGTIVTAGRASG